MAEDFGRISSFIWGTADLIRDSFRRGHYQDVILPMTVLRRIDCVLAPTHDKVLKRYGQLKGQIDNLERPLARASGYAFYNTSKFTFGRMLDDADNIARNLRAWINGFSENMFEVLQKFDFDNTIAKLDEADLLYLVVQRFHEVDLHPDEVDNHTMGLVFEDLIRRFNEALDENPGEHFTPRDVVRLMARLMIEPDHPELRVPHKTKTICDPCCGTGGMLTVAQELIRELNDTADIHLYGQEVNPQTFAVTKSDLFLSTPSGREAENIFFGSALSNDRHDGALFDYLLANPPYGKDWKRDKDAVVDEHALGEAGRFAPGLPRISDGQTLFLMHMVHHMKPLERGGSRVLIIMNGSPLFTGDAGSGESEIRRWLMERDLVEAIVALPEQLFYNTGIATYVWVISNRKPGKRRGKVQLINASGEDFWRPMRKSLGDKRREIAPEQIDEIVRLYKKFEDAGVSKIFPSTDFGYRKITVERPLRLSFQVTEERIVALEREKAFERLVTSRKKGKAGSEEIEKGREMQDAILQVLSDMASDDVFTGRDGFAAVLDEAFDGVGTPLKAPIRKAILNALSQRDEDGEICLDKDGNQEPDPKLRDTENVQLLADVEEYFEREVAPHVPDAWINEEVCDPKDGGVGKVGYEINFNRSFYVYTPPRPLAVIEAEIKELEGEIVRMLREVTG